MGFGFVIPEIDFFLNLAYAELAQRRRFPATRADTALHGQLPVQSGRPRLIVCRHTLQQ